MARRIAVPDANPLLANNRCGGGEGGGGGRRGGVKKKHKHTRTSLHNKMKVMSYYGLGLVECGIHPIRRDSLRYFQIYPSIVIVLPLRSCLGSLRIVQDR